METDSFSHNTRSELIGSNLGGANALAGAYVYGYDPIGNRAYASATTAGSTKQSHCAANALNQYTGISTAAAPAPLETFEPQFDADGYHDV